MGVLPGIGVISVGGARDPFWNNVQLLAPGDGVSGQTTGLDKSQYARAITCFGNAATSTAQSKFGGGSLVFDGTGDYMTSDDTFAAFGTADLTIEFWMRTNIRTETGLVDFRQANGDAEPNIRLSSTFQLQFWTNNAQRLTGPIVANNAWVHVAASRVSGIWRFFVDGVQYGTTFNDGPANLSRRRLTLGAWVNRRDATASFKFNGNLDDFRLTVGTGRYTAAFTPPTSAFPLR